MFEAPPGRQRTARLCVAKDAHPELPTCEQHPGSLVRRYRAQGPNGPGLHPQCVPANDEPSHLLVWSVPVVAETHEQDLHVLSPSEQEVLEDAAHGLTVDETASSRSKGAETVKTQRRSILLKLGARNMAHAVALSHAQRDEHDRRASARNARADG